jgi:hypothetical protein
MNKLEMSSHRALGGSNKGGSIRLQRFDEFSDRVTPGTK